MVLCISWRKKNIETQEQRESQQQRSGQTDAELGDSSKSSDPDCKASDLPPSMEDDCTVPELYTPEHNITKQTVRWLTRLDGKLRKFENILSSRPRRAPPGEQTQDIPMSIRLQWKTLTVVLDRLFIILFFLLNVIALVLFYPRRHCSV